MNGLAQVALRCLSPGVPGCYQGTEFWDLSLVDPDNRRRVDYDARTAAPSRAAGSVLDLLQTWRDGRVKQAPISTLLHVRKNTPELFARGAYVPLGVHGSRAKKVIAFVRSMGNDSALIAVPLHCAQHCTEMPCQILYFGVKRPSRYSKSTGVDGNIYSTTEAVWMDPHWLAALCSRDFPVAALI